MRHHIITNKEAKQVFKAYNDTRGKFDTPAARLLVERLADKAASMTLDCRCITPDGRTIAAHVASTGDLITTVGNLRRSDLPASLYNDNPSVPKFKVDFSKYDIVTTGIWAAYKNSYSFQNFLAVMRKSNADKPKLAKEIYDKICASFDALRDQYSSVGGGLL